MDRVGNTVTTPNEEGRSRREVRRLRGGNKDNSGGPPRLLTFVRGLLTKIAEDLSPRTWKSRRQANGQSQEPTEGRRLFSTFSFLVSKQGATAAIGLIYWSLATHL